MPRWNPDLRRATRPGVLESNTRSKAGWSQADGRALIAMRYRRVEPTRRLYTRGAETDGPVSTPRAVIALPCSLCAVSSAVEQLIPPLPFRSCSSDREEHL